MVSVALETSILAKLGRGENLTSAEIQAIGGIDALNALIDREAKTKPGTGEYDPKSSPTYKRDKAEYLRRKGLKEHQRSAVGSRGEFYGQVILIGFLLLMVLLVGPSMCS